MSSAAIVAGAGVLAAAIDLANKSLELVLSRVRPQGQVSSTVRIVALRGDVTESPLPDGKRLRELRYLYGALTAVSICLVVYGGRTYLYDSYSSGALLTAEGLFLFAVGMQAFYRLKNARPGRPLHSVSLKFEVVGDKVQVAQTCLTSMAKIGAIRSTGAIQFEDSKEGVIIKGGTGAWPRRGRGNRVEIIISACRVEDFSIAMSSQTYRPALLDSYRNARNTTRLLQCFLTAPTPPEGPQFRRTRSYRSGSPRPSGERVDRTEMEEALTKWRDPGSGR
jgi:hypothetical protein